MHPKVSIAYFITPHGFGHAARAAAVMEAIQDKWPFVHFEIFGQTPEWFFMETPVSCRFHNVQTDIGMVQKTAMSVDLPGTVNALDTLFPVSADDLSAIADCIRSSECRLILCDISPVGLTVGKRAGIPTVLIENFTWDWIYGPHAIHEKRLLPHIEYLESVFASADRRIQTVPYCRPAETAVRVPPVSRKPRTDSGTMRRRLGIGEGERMVLITMGGIPETHRFIERLNRFAPGVHFVIPGGYPDLPETGERMANVTLLPHRSAYYHPDLVHAADAVVGKAGYSTVAEVYNAGVPFGYLTRPDFIESDVLADFIDTEIPSVRIAGEGFAGGDWLDCLPELLSRPKIQAGRGDGAREIADYVCRMIASAEELLEVVDPEGAILGAAPRRCVHGKCEWLHRVIHVLVFDRKNRLLLQKRAMTKTVAPGKWDTSVGGHVDCGESIETAVFREICEELGIRPESLEFAYRYIHSNKYESELVHTYACRYDGPIRFNPEEIDAVKFWEPTEIEANLGKGIFSDNFEDEFLRFRRWSAGADGTPRNYISM